MSARPAMLLRKARLRGAGADAQGRLAAALDRVDPAAAGIGGNRVLVLGRMAAPVPLPPEGTIAGSHDMDRFARRFEQALSQRVGAARRGKPGAGADGDWLFEDDAELDCALVLAMERHGDSAAATLLRTVTGTQRPDLRLHWRRHVLPDAARAAVTIARLAEAGGAAAGAWLAGFDAGELRAAAARIVQHHGGIASPDVAGDRPSAQRDASDELAASDPAALSATLSATGRAVSELAASLAPIAAQARAGVTEPEAARVMLVALVAQRRPAVIGLAVFAATVERLLQPAVRPATGAEPVGEGARLRTGSAAMACAADQPAQAVPQETQPVAGEPDATSMADPAIAGTGTLSADVSRTAIRETAFGGLLFLLNAFTALGLWGDFTRPGDGLPGLSPFELLIRLGRHWFGKAFLADPLHGVLRDLAGLRPGEAAGRHFAAPPWSVPDHWLTPWPDARARPRHGTMWHPAGFALDDPGAAARHAAGQRRHWTTALARYLRARSAAALGVSADAALALLCCRRAALDIARESMVVRMSLQDHPLVVRMAGLDRDPGRLAGCVHAVVFEFAA